MIDRKKIRAAVDYYENEGYGNHIGILIELAEAYLNKELVEPMSESEIIKEISSIRSRIVEIRDSLIGDDNRKGYGLDEWSPPYENLSYLIKKIDGLAQSIVGKVGKREEK